MDTTKELVESSPGRRPLKCRDCLATHVAQRSDAKFCPSCRLLRVLLFASTKLGWIKKCVGCKSRFMLLHAREPSLCGACEAETRPADDPQVDCVFCKERGHPALRKSPVPACVSCAKNPVQRPQVIKALRKGKRTRSAANVEVA